VSSDRPEQGSPQRFVCVHGHFYQPQRENPWLEMIEVQDSARPWHDWNERIDAECYAPNACARRLGPDGRIEAIVNNYAQISFNFGPTLLGWLERESPETYAAILAADRASRERFSGHGNALAQVHGHVILPLANERDRRTQVVWGLRDFEHRFGRRAEGMWLAETAVDSATLELLAEQGVRFTILAPAQAQAVRRIAGGRWKSVSGARIDPTQPYSIRLPSGRDFTLFFYDGPISRAVAFEGLLADGARFADRLASGFDDSRGRTELVHIATDGETYGHHHKHGEMALAAALERLESKGTARITNYGEHLDRVTPTHRVQIRERTSWSCEHGVDRWWRDCGCNSGGKPGWNQAWRTPLRDALDWLRDALAPQFEQLGGELLRAPWAARDDYIEVMLARSTEAQDEFLARHALRELSEEEKVRALELLEMQRNAMLMYTSCGWFFDDLGGIETVQVIQYASRALELARKAGGADLEPEFERRLGAARGNVPEHGAGDEIYRRFVRPARVDLRAVAVHYALRALYDPPGEEQRVGCYRTDRVEIARSVAGRQVFLAGLVAIRSETTREQRSFAFGALHLGDHDAVAGVRPREEEQALAELSAQGGELFGRGEYAEVLRALDRHFDGALESLRSLFRDEQRRIVERILDTTLAEAETTLRGVYEGHSGLMRFLASLGTPPPEVLRVSAAFALQRALRTALQQPVIDVEHVRALFEAARIEGVELDRDLLARAVEEAVLRRMRDLAGTPEDPVLLRETAALAGLALELPFPVEMWRAQNIGWGLRERLLGARGNGGNGSNGGDANSSPADLFRELADKLHLRVEGS
jgi:alpha-amylase/alpha-mannosidase (GH57 family)